MTDAATILGEIQAIIYQCDRGNVSLPWLVDCLRGIEDRARADAQKAAPAEPAEAHIARLDAKMADSVGRFMSPDQSDLDPHLVEAAANMLAQKAAPPAAQPDEPTTHELTVQLREALGLFAGAMPVTPKAAWDEAIDVLRQRLKAAPPAAQPGRQALIDALELMWDRYENGDPCHDSDDPIEGNFIGNAVRLFEDEERQILALIPSSPAKPTRAFPITLLAAPVEPAPTPPATDAVRDALMKARELVEIMVASSTVLTDAEGVVTGYQVKTGALHKLIGLFGATVPLGLPEVGPNSLRDAADALLKTLSRNDNYDEQERPSDGKERDALRAALAEPAPAPADEPPPLPSDEEIEAWADSIIRTVAYHRPSAVQIAMEAAKWVRGFKR
jgi:hypothetical protein